MNAEVAVSLRRKIFPTRNVVLTSISDDCDGITYVNFFLHVIVVLLKQFNILTPGIEAACTPAVHWRELGIHNH